MMRLLFFAVACLAAAGSVFAQTARLDVRALDGPQPESRLPQNVQRATKTAETAPKMRLESTVTAAGGAPFQGAIEWFVLGRREGQPGAAPGTGFLLIQSSKETVNAKPGPGVKSIFFAYGPGQVRNAIKSDGWMARLVTADGRVLDTKASHPFFLALVRDPARLDALLAAKTSAEATTPEGDVEVPADVLARIKAEAEKTWPGNAEMQAFEIKSRIDQHKAAYRK